MLKAQCYAPSCDPHTQTSCPLLLLSVRAPRPGGRDRAGEPWSSEAKEYLRKRAIGREVEVKMEYNRKVRGAAERGVRLRLGLGVVVVVGA